MTLVMSQPTIAPAPPGRLGQASPAPELLAYLQALGAWRDGRHAELQRVDAAALRAKDADSYTADLALVMSMWQAVSDRHDKLVKVFDSGRADRQAREEMSRLIWGRLDGALGVSLVEATRLCDSLTATLRARLSFDPMAGDVAGRITAVRAGLYRCSELVAQHRGIGADIAGRVDVLQRRVAELGRRAQEGADVSGPFALLEADAARLERDLIVTAAGMADLARDRDAARAHRDRLEEREDALRLVAERCAAEIAAPPRLAVPDLDALGPVPEDRAALDAYRAKLEQVAAAIAFAESAYVAPLAERVALRARLAGTAGATATTTVPVGTRTGTGPGAGPSLAAALAAVTDAARSVLDAVPCDLDAARRLMAAREALIQQAPPRRASR
jgi:hypothetical protein